MTRVSWEVLGEHWGDTGGDAGGLQGVCRAVVLSPPRTPAAGAPGEPSRPRVSPAGRPPAGPALTQAVPGAPGTSRPHAGRWHRARPVQLPAGARPRRLLRAPGERLRPAPKRRQLPEGLRGAQPHRWPQITLCARRAPTPRALGHLRAVSRRSRVSDPSGGEASPWQGTASGGLIPPDPSAPTPGRGAGSPPLSPATPGRPPSPEAGTVRYVQTGMYFVLEVATSQEGKAGLYLSSLLRPRCCILPFLKPWWEPDGARQRGEASGGSQGSPQAGSGPSSPRSTLPPPSRRDIEGNFTQKCPCPCPCPIPGFPAAPHPRAPQPSCQASGLALLPPVPVFPWLRVPLSPCPLSPCPSVRPAGARLHPQPVARTRCSPAPCCATLAAPPVNSSSSSPPGPAPLPPAAPRCPPVPAASGAPRGVPAPGGSQAPSGCKKSCFDPQNGQWGSGSGGKDGFDPWEEEDPCPGTIGGRVYYLLFIIYYLLFIIYYLLFIIYYLLFIIYYLLFIIYYLLFIIYYLLSIICYLLSSLIYYHLLSTIYYLLFVIYYLLSSLIYYHLLSTIYYLLLFIIYHLSFIIYLPFII
ncbi:basic proline-rich protein-like [Passer domesticus]|uniref:basic proline-rich protein-like n=1 Tax=Passer domesticus TaxID=48849 RepID=UPI0030FF2D9A